MLWVAQQHASNTWEERSLSVTVTTTSTATIFARLKLGLGASHSSYSICLVSTGADRPTSATGDFSPRRKNGMVAATVQPEPMTRQGFTLS